MLTRTVIKHATRQMRLYGETKGGALSHLSSRVVGPVSQHAARPSASAAVSENFEDKSVRRRRIRVWDEELGANVLQDA